MTLKTKLTHVDEFRKNFIRGLLILVGAAALFAITQFLLTFSEEMYLIIQPIILITLFTATIMIINGLFKLDEYLNSIIGSEQKNRKLISLIGGLAVPGIIFSIQLLLIELTDLVTYIATLLTYILFYFIFFYSLFLHQNMKELKTSMMLQFGVGFLILNVPQLLGFFEGLTDTGLYWIIFQSCYIAFIICLIVGYWNFKNRINKIQESVK